MVITLFGFGKGFLGGYKEPNTIWIRKRTPSWVWGPKH